MVTPVAEGANALAKSSSWRPVVAAATALVAISYFWLANAYFGARSDILPEELPSLAAVTAGVLLIQLTVLVAFRRFAVPLSAIFGAVNTYFLYGALSPKLAGFPFFIQIPVYTCIAFLYFAALDLWLKSRRLYPIILAALPAVVLAYASIGYAAGPSAPRDTEAGKPPVRLASRPNIYFLSYDSLLPESLARSYLGIPPPAYMAAIERHGGRVLPNTFADSIPTKFSLSSMLMMQPYLENTENIVNGFARSPLRDVLSDAGYETHFTFKVSYFGHNKGPFLDHYNVYEPYSLCDFLKGRRKALAFFGYCNADWMHVLAPPKKTPTQSYEDFSFALIRAVSEQPDTRPQFYMEHALGPYHTESDYDGSPAQKAAFVAHYQEGADQAARMMDRSLTQIRSADPDAIIFVYGDHGAYTSRQIEFADDPSTFVKDRYGTLAAVFNADQCLPFIEAPTGGKFHTTTQVVAGIVQCLAKDHASPRPGFDYNPIRQISDQERFETYVYE